MPSEDKLDSAFPFNLSSVSGIPFEGFVFGFFWGGEITDQIHTGSFNVSFAHQN